MGDEPHTGDRSLVTHLSRYRLHVKSPLPIGLAIVVAACASSATEPTLPSGADSVPVVRVLDGDSLLVDLGGSETEVRLLGINAPERDECFDAEAKARATDLAGDAVRLTGDDTDRFGRLLRYAYTTDGLLINEKLVADGMALALSTDHALRREFKAAEAEAFGARTGRWQPDACGPASSLAIEIAGLEPDAPGDDARNPNGEWVEIVNRGDTGADLTGWAMQDESSSHRFEFPDGFTLAPDAAVRIFSGCGDARAAELFWCDDDPVWSNRGDTAYLLDPAGNVADRASY